MQLSCDFGEKNRNSWKKQFLLKCHCSPTSGRRTVDVFRLQTTTTKKEKYTSLTEKNSLEHTVWFLLHRQHAVGDYMLIVVHYIRSCDPCPCLAETNDVSIDTLEHISHSHVTWQALYTKGSGIDCELHDAIHRHGEREAQSAKI